MLEQVIGLAEQTGKEIMEIYARGVILSHEKGDKSPVTDADVVAHKYILGELTSTGIPVLSEEGEVLVDAERMWIVDPLDGTKDFLARTGDFSVMIALVENDVPVLAVVHAPALGATYAAERGKGAFVRDAAGERKLHVSGHEAYGGRLIASAHHFSPLMSLVGEKLHALLSRRGSNGVKAGLIANGEGDYMFNDAPLSVWDIAAPQLIITEAGGKVTDTGGEEIRYDSGKLRSEHGFVGSNGVAHARVLEAIKELRNG